MNCYEQQYSGGLFERRPDSVRQQLERGMRTDWRRAEETGYGSETSPERAEKVNSVRHDERLEQEAGQEMKNQCLSGCKGYTDAGWSFQTFQPSFYEGTCRKKETEREKEGKPQNCLTVPEKCSDFPVGMSYVPIQQWSRPSDMETAFTRGTIFKELDLPFLKGRCR